MDLEKVFHMNRGTGEYSYAQNSHIQKQCLDNVMPITQEAAIKMLSTDFPNIIRIADMGCSSGPNTFSVLNTIIHAICLRYQEVSRKIPEFQVYLNDLPANDFNSVFRQLPSFYELMKEKEERVCDSCFVAGVPGSFYRRLFPANSLHFVHSSYSLQWLSKASSSSLATTIFSFQCAVT
ncbi:LOW QUALITY PROTEIN: probable caffeine synthase 3 [Amborella trichopoda]|uniref:LOW QUALITY PROTEIN: probable caffeine synthase 3 n=1 Tax=Amborella trichopoda TaxID=13333 RepID=UPI0009C14872|nr:LOW QUALITY PROTEIN: probable caffeine synthase 3 [Amborella trichopoda]|eukprot:XP_020524214.1 LOW QUALITY PROTEIN: probable caffeine synthase 3 [Amborella trichopoda]